MTNNNYRRGSAFERYMKEKLEKEGYFVVRAAGSHGVADLVAIKHLNKGGLWGSYHEILFISCKIPMYAPPAERKALVGAAEKVGAVPMMTVKDKKGKWELERVVV